MFWTCLKLHTLAWVGPAAREAASLERLAASNRCTLAGNPAGGEQCSHQLQGAHYVAETCRVEEHDVGGVAISSHSCRAAS